VSVKAGQFHPVRLEEVPVPAEIKHLLYADFTGDFDRGFATVLDALTREATIAAEERERLYLYALVDRLILDVFDWRAIVPHGNEYQQFSFRAAGIEQPNGREIQIVVEIEDVHGHGTPPRPLGPAWLADFLDAEISQIELYALVVSRRPVEIDLPELEGTYGRVRVHSDPRRGAVYVVDISDRPGNDAERERIEMVRKDIERRERTRSYDAAADQDPV
jgi:hypothetical protein